MTLAPRTLSFVLSLPAILAFAFSATAQQPAQPSAPTVAVSLTASGVRFVALGAVRQTRLEVYDSSGAPVFDSGFLPGNVRDWAAQGRGLADGAYTCVLTARDLVGRLSLKQGMVVLSGGQLSLALGGAEPAGEVETGATVPAAEDAGGAQAATLSTHDGRDGAVTSTAGALTLRTGDVLRGEDRERVRVTPEGLVGVGTDRPEATLDVAGAVRARGGFKFSDGSTLSARGGRLTLTSESGEEVSAQGVSVAAATANRLAKFTDGAGTLGDSAVTEVGGLVGVGTSSPSTPVDVVYSDNNFGFGVNIRNTNTGQFALVGYGINNASGSRVGQFTYAPPAYVEASLRDTILFSSAGPTTKLGFVSSADGSGTPDIYIRAGGARPNSIYVQGSTGDVGVGTDSPAAKLHVAGAVNFTGLRTEATTVQPGPKPGPPNVIGGFLGTGAGGATPGNRVTAGVVGASIGGGGFNGALTIGEATLTGDSTNRVTDWFGTVGGGLLNRAGNDDSTPDNRYFATVGGGFGNTAANSHATVGGGLGNTASGLQATVGGGRGNTASGVQATVGGGHNNVAGGVAATVGGGDSNIIGGDYATVAGGRHNGAGGPYSFAAGWRATALHQGAFVWADATNAEFASTGENQFLVRAGGGVGINTNEPPAGGLGVNGSLRVDTDTLTVDSANNRVGVGTASPVSDLSVRRDAQNNLGPVLNLMNGGGNGGAAAALDFSTFDTGANPASARVMATDANNFGAHLTFWTKEPGAASKPLVERVRISEAGNVGVGTSNPNSALQINGYLQLSVTAGAPPAEDCNAGNEHGRMKVDAGNSRLYVCTSAGWRAATLVP